MTRPLIDLDVETEVDVYNKRFPERPTGAFRSLSLAADFCALAILEDRELTADERAQFEYQDNDDIFGSRF